MELFVAIIAKDDGSVVGPARNTAMVVGSGRPHLGPHGYHASIGRLPKAVPQTDDTFYLPAPWKLPRLWGLRLLDGSCKFSSARPWLQLLHSVHICIAFRKGPGLSPRGYSISWQSVFELGQDAMDKECEQTRETHNGAHSSGKECNCLSYVMLATYYPFN
jgi:hypothetical protein